ncbi:TolC family protein [Algoriphagus marinus]|uniref:TolC family protein n=1 Tax=Algoriphagus marinus TaxID=1925762 RepID=UPI000B0F8F0C|nr:TolC family protein [Algoriphagus marinus]
MKTIVLLFLLLLSTTLASAQDFQGLTMERLRPLEVLIQDALANAPLINRLSKGQAQKEQEIMLNRKAWMQHVALTGGYNYGNGVVADNLVSPVDNQSVFRTSTFSTYSMGISLRLPISEFTTQKNKVKIHQLAIEELEYQKEDLRNVITEEVIKRYNSLERALTTIKLQALKVEANEAAVQVTETYFKSGTADIDQYRMALDILTTAKIELEKTKSDAWYYKRTLEEIVGASILN